VADYLDDNVGTKKEAKPVASSFISMVEYDFETHELVVHLKNGRVYRYTVSEELYYQFMDAESQGKFFIANIKPLGGSRV
jgi:hypothetical protein